MKERTLDQLRDSSILGKLSGRTRKAIEALTTSRLAEQALAEVENESVAERQALVNELAALNKRISADSSRAGANLTKATRANEAAEDAFRRAGQALRDALMQAQAIDYGFRAEQVRITKALHESADTRLADFVFRLDGIRDCDLVMAVQCWPDPKKKRDGLEPAISGNLPDVVAAKAAVQAAADAAEALRLKAVTYADVSEHLFAACEQLAPVLAKVEINPPSLTAADAEVGRPRRFQGVSEWIFESNRELTKEERAAEQAIALANVASSDKVN